MLGNIRPIFQAGFLKDTRESVVQPLTKTIGLERMAQLYRRPYAKLTQIRQGAVRGKNGAKNARRQL